MRNNRNNKFETQNAHMKDLMTNEYPALDTQENVTAGKCV